MKRMIILARILLMTVTTATAQIKMNQPEAQLLFFNSISTINTKEDALHEKNTHKVFRHTSDSRQLTNTILPGYTINNKMGQNSFYVKTFETDPDEGGINFKMAERTLLNIELGCYQSLSKTDVNDTCDQGPGFDMSISLVFDLE